MNVAGDRPILSINSVRQFLLTTTDLQQLCENDQPSQFLEIPTNRYTKLDPPFGVPNGWELGIGVPLSNLLGWKKHHPFGWGWNINILGGGNSNMFGIFIPILGEDDPNMTKGSS